MMFAWKYSRDFWQIDTFKLREMDGPAKASAAAIGQHLGEITGNDDVADHAVAEPA